MYASYDPNNPLKRSMPTFEIYVKELYGTRPKAPLTSFADGLKFIESCNDPNIRIGTLKEIRVPHDGRIHGESLKSFKNKIIDNNTPYYPEDFYIAEPQISTSCTIEEPILKSLPLTPQVTPKRGR